MDNIDSHRRINKKVIPTEEKDFTKNNIDNWFNEVDYYFREKEFYYSSYSHISIHEAMIKDKVRTQSYKLAIDKNKFLFKDKVVLDIGSGTGILSLFSASNGAKHVYAVENSSIAYFSQQIIIKNGYQDKITIIKGKIEEIELPVNKVDIIISEWMGYFLLFESMIDSVIFARDKWLDKNGLILPDQFNLNVALSNQGSSNRESKLNYWDNVYGFDFSNLKSLVNIEPSIEICNKHLICSEICKIFEIDMYTIKKEDVDFSSSWSVRIFNSTSDITSMISWFDVNFNKGLESKVAFTTSPYNTSTHWKQTAFYLDEEIQNLSNKDIVFGSISVKKNKNNIREMDIKISFNFPYYSESLSIEKENTKDFEKEYKDCNNNQYKAGFPSILSTETKSNIKYIKRVQYFHLT